MGVVDETLKILNDARTKSDAVLVAYSGGKDSLVTIDLCARTFKTLEAFFMYLVPGLECVEMALDAAERKFGMKIRQYPHWICGRLLKNGVYCNSYFSKDIPDWALRDVYDLASAEARIKIIATGAKRSDSQWRKRNLAACPYDDVIYPIVGWTKPDVISYLKNRKIPIPESSGGNATGIDLSTPSLLWLHDNHPRDFVKLCEVFPFAEAVVWRRTFDNG